MNKKGSFVLIFLVMAVSIGIAAFWNSLPLIKNSVNAILNPTAGSLLNWNMTLGMVILIFLLSVFMTLIQKYTTDQKAMREIREDQKKMQEDMKKFEVGSKEHTELSMKSMKSIGPMFRHSMRPIIYTAIPIILLFRWFTDFFALVDFRFFGFLSWFWFYLIGSIIFSSILRKVFNVV